MSEEIFKENSNLPIEFHFSPYYGSGSTNAVEKSDTDGKKRMYVEGIASGPKVDLHQERMTEKAIQSFMAQANSGTILLYPDVHGIRSTTDIGILKSAEITPTGDWRVSFRLYDAMDGVAQTNVDTAMMTWKQLSGLPPYTKPLKKGFSIEGIIPPTGILVAEKDEQGNPMRRVIDDVLLDGVIICPRPAYNDSIVTAVYKTLGEMNPYKQDKVKKSIYSSLRESIQEKELNDLYFRKKWDIGDALQKETDLIMKKPDADKSQQLEILFDEYKRLMIELLMASESLFQEKEDNSQIADPYGLVGVAKSELSELDRLRGVRKSLIEFKKNHNL